MSKVLVRSEPAAPSPSLASEVCAPSSVACSGCGSTETLRSLQARGFIACCPDRRRDEPRPYCPRCADWTVEEYDDGSRVEMESYTGGGHALGAWGELSLRFIDKDGCVTFRTYRAIAPEDGSRHPVASDGEAALLRPNQARGEA